MENEKKKGFFATLWESMNKTGGCCGAGESCCGSAKEDDNKTDENDSAKESDN